MSLHTQGTSCVNLNEALDDDAAGLLPAIRLQK